MAKALYRRYRPKRFSDVIGQDAVCRTLKNQVRTGRISHAYILTGIRGTGKTTIAKILSRAVNCLDPQDGEPCGECSVCRGLEDGSILDVTEIDAASNNSVDDIRQLREESSFAPTVCRYRVYIIDEVHMLSSSAWAALLKIIEEPPEHIIFILATTDIQKVPATILSRCQRFDLKRLTNEDVRDHLLEIAGREDIDLTEDAAEQIARLSDGAMRDALSILDTCSSTGEKVTLELVNRLTGSIDKQYLSDIARAVRDGDGSSMAEILGRLYSGSMEPGRLVMELLRYYRDLLIMSLGCRNVLTEYSDEEKDRLAETAKGYPRNRIYEDMDSLRQASAALQSSPDRRLTCEVALLGMTDRGGSPSGRPEPPARREKPVSRPSHGTAAEPAARKPEPEKKAEEAGNRQDDEKSEPSSPEAAAPHSDGYTKVDGWEKVIGNLKDNMLAGFLAGSEAYLDSKRLLISGSDVFFSYMREHPEANSELKACIKDTLGISRPIGPLRKKAVFGELEPDSPGAEKPKGPVDKILEKAREAGVKVIYK
ncbi:MAG: DNA polymerase III subunit gamma/tau [Oscillospiraceae bacterium]|jgi:DNA polymerase-3 subunit gamma/tau